MVNFRRREKARNDNDSNAPKAACPGFPYLLGAVIATTMQGNGVLTSVRLTRSTFRGVGFGYLTTGIDLVYVVSVRILQRENSLPATVLQKGLKKNENSKDDVL